MSVNRIGRAAANLFAQHGAKVVVSDIDKGAGDKVVQELASNGFEGFSVPGDILKDGFPEELIATVIQKFGRVNCLVNNAGFLMDNAIHRMEDHQFDGVMKIHNYAPFRLIRALSAHWRDPQYLNIPKSIINISSTSGLHGQYGQINYATAKAGVVGMTKAAAKELARYNVRCNAVAYGFMDTRMTRPPSTETQRVGDKEIQVGVSLNAKRFRDLSDIPLGRVGTVDEAAGPLLFLASPLASYITGTILECTGGRHM
ncbi:hypothetical protein F5884DRAFT_901992 [Xylogone sp. PMI_703]|nr:hypothetical protein F5884DRAFT_901992 [Xylogone sp. PMI_703]